jgi:single-stranded-DNA-specific exonuclease
MAAGLTVEEAKIDELAAWLDAQLAPAVARASAERVVALDLSVTPGGLTPALVETLDSAGPFGVGWPAPRIAVGPVRLVRAELVGSDHVRLIASGQDGSSFKAIAFRAAESATGQDRRLGQPPASRVAPRGCRLGRLTGGAQAPRT